MVLGIYVVPLVPSSSRNRPCLTRWVVPDPWFPRPVRAGVPEPTRRSRGEPVEGCWRSTVPGTGRSPREVMAARVHIAAMRAMLRETSA